LSSVFLCCAAKDFNQRYGMAASHLSAEALYTFLLLRSKFIRYFGHTADFKG
jgi:hypothetical protein